MSLVLFAPSTTMRPSTSVASATGRSWSTWAACFHAASSSSSSRTALGRSTCTTSGTSTSTAGAATQTHQQRRGFARQSQGAQAREKAVAGRASGLQREEERAKKYAFVGEVETENEWRRATASGEKNAALGGMDPKETRAKAAAKRSRFELPEAPRGGPMQRIMGGDGTQGAVAVAPAFNAPKPRPRSISEIRDEEIREIFPTDLISQPREVGERRLVRRPHLWIEEEGMVELGGETMTRQEERHALLEDGELTDADCVDEIRACERELARLEGADGAGGSPDDDDVDLAGESDFSGTITPSEDEDQPVPLNYASDEQLEAPVNLRNKPPRLSDVGRFQRFSRDELLELLPEGVSGELSRDIILVPSHTRDIGWMLRKVTVEILSQLAFLQKDAERAFDHQQKPGKIPPALISSRAGWLLEGKKGVGKSAILNHVVTWARSHGWLVIFEPFCANYAKEISEIARSANSGIYVQNAHARRFLERSLVKNAEFFEQMAVDFAVYGASRTVDGESSGKVRKAYDELIEKAVQRDFSEKLNAPAGNCDTAAINRERLFKFRRYRDKVALPSLAKKLPAPETLFDLVQFGIDNETWATQVVAELFLQLQKQTKFPLLVCVDEWNECFPVSDYVSMRYDGTRRRRDQTVKEATGFGGYIPAYHLSMVRSLMNFDGVKYRRGVKLYATSWYRMNRRDWKPELLGVPAENVKQVREFTPFEFANYCGYFRLQNITHQFPRDKLEQFWMLTQGNGWQARRALSMLY